MREAMALKRAGVKELLVILKHLGLWRGFENKPVLGQYAFEVQVFDLCQALAKVGIWVRLHYVYPYPHVDKIVAMMTTPTARADCCHISTFRFNTLANRC